MSTAIKPPSRPAIEYPDSDGKPMADNTLQFQWIVTIKEGNEALFRDRPDVFVAGDLLWYPVEGDNKTRQAPDTLIAFGRPKGRRGSYRQWEEGGIAPQVVFEVLSPGNRRGEMERKFAFYERFGVEEYYVYDPDTGSLEGWLRRGRGLKKVRRMAGFVSPRLGIRFEPGKGPDNLRIIRPDGERFKTFQEIDAERAEFARQRDEAACQRDEAACQRDEAARQRDEAARQRDEAACQRDEAARQRDEAARREARLAAKLKELGIDPAAIKD
jgi:Uma2 family endonuclease